MKKTTQYLAIVIVLSMLFGAASGLLSVYYANAGRSPTIVSADIRLLAENKKQEIVKKYQSSESKESSSAELEREYREFVTRLDKALDDFLEQNSNVLILRREAVIDGKHRDITEEIRNAVK